MVSPLKIEGRCRLILGDSQTRFIAPHLLDPSKTALISTSVAFYTTWLPSGAEHGATGIAFILQAPLLLAHSYDKNLTGITIHVTTAICWFAGGLCSFYEMNNRNNIMATLGRCYFLALGSFWFFHAGGVLMHVHPFDMNHMNLSAALQIYYLSIYFVVDALALMLLFLGICARIYKTTKNEHPNKFYVSNFSSEVSQISKKELNLLMNEEVPTAALEITHGRPERTSCTGCLARPGSPLVAGEKSRACQQAGQSSSFRSMASCSELPFFRKKYPKIHFEVLLGTPLLALDFLEQNGSWREGANDTKSAHRLTETMFTPVPLVDACVYQGSDYTAT
ncbi:unnamed protein product [Cyprideis torosa]|uniref:Uncharacterized protein n=1 Tax=Cyprideis torosa TaxID=163714 RepID=A0A7R8ZNF4_9CRUS|nr:unnamed protein product [Cyprideis torosa]CAG0897871.1 unnamed protein product [Cyprideis torosa]